MRRIAALFVLLCMLLNVVPVMAEMDYIGDMEVVNCNEWVSLREFPSTSAKRLVKVSLGAVVSNCRQYSDEWICAEYDGHVGYILAEYLLPCAGSLTFNAMLVTITGDGAPFYATIDSQEPIDFIPTNTIVRNCCIMDNNRIYVEWGSRCGFISLLHAEVYNEMLHFPSQIVLYENLFADDSVHVDTPLKIADSRDFSIKDYDYNAYEYDDYMAADSEEVPKVSFVLYSETTVNHVHLFNVSMSAFDGDAGEVVYEATLEHIQPQVDAEHPLRVGAVIWGDTPNLAVGYEDEQGAYHFAFVEISGEDGRMVLREF